MSLTNVLPATITRPATAVALVRPIRLRLPFHRYLELWGDRPYSFLLDSALTDGRLGRFSFLAGDPTLVFRTRRQAGRPRPAPARISLTRYRDDQGQPLSPPRLSTWQADPFQQIRLLMNRYRIAAQPDVDTPLPLVGGLVGYLGYEMLYFIENVPDTGSDDLHLPDCCLVLFDALLAHDHLAGQSYACLVGRGPDRSTASVHAKTALGRLMQRVRNFESSALPEPVRPQRPREVQPRRFFDRNSYARLVGLAKDHIAAGDVFELCLTHRLEASYPGDPWRLYCRLRQINPAPFAAYLKLPEATILCASPERFLRLSADGWAESRPIKGTRPRGADPAEDARLRRDLATSPKDRAENTMIVDLVRNDLGRVCHFGSISVPEPMAIETYATVFQMVSTVRGQLAQGRDAVDLIRACFPGGSMTGAPKVQAMKLIDRFEPVKRGIYSGAIGYLDLRGNMDLNIVIRTIVLKNRRAYINVGGAIVADSDPQAEYDETIDKARALLAALQTA